MSAEKVGVGYAGVGKHAEWSHIQPQMQDPHASIEVLHDLDPDRLARVAGTFPSAPRSTGEWDKLLSDPAVDAIYVITPDKFHTSQLVDILSAGKHAFIEKPLADNWSDFEKLRRALSDAPVETVISTCHPRRFDSPFVLTKQLLDDKALLAATFGLSSETDFGPARSFALDLNYSRPTKTGLHTLFASDHMPHEIDTTSDFFGLQGLRYAVSHVNEELEFDIEAEREDGMQLRFKGNRLQTGDPQYREDWRIGFDEGVELAVDAGTGEIMLLQNHRLIAPVKRPIKYDGNGLPRASFNTDYDSRFDDLNKHFIAAVRGNEVHYLTRQEMLMNTVVALALQEVNRPVAISADGDVTRL